MLGLSARLLEGFRWHAVGSVLETWSVEFLLLLLLHVGLSLGNVLLGGLAYAGLFGNFDLIA